MVWWGVPRGPTTSFVGQGYQKAGTPLAQDLLDVGEGIVQQGGLDQLQ